MWLVSLSCLSALGSFCDLPSDRGAFVLDLRWLTQIEYEPVALYAGMMLERIWLYLLRHACSCHM